MLIRPANQKSVIFATIDIFEIKGLNFNQMFVMDTLIYEPCLLTLVILLF